MVLRKLDLPKEAVDVFVEAIHSLPLHWGAWLELSNLVTNIEMVTNLVFSHAETIEICRIESLTPGTKVHSNQLELNI